MCNAPRMILQPRWIAPCVLVLLTAVACGGSVKRSTSITSSWKKPGESAKKFQKIAAVAIVETRINRDLVEKSIVRQFKARGLSATHSMEVLQETGQKLSKAELQAKFRDAGIDAVLTVRVRSADVEQLKADHQDAGYIVAENNVFYGDLHVYYYTGETGVYDVSVWGDRDDIDDIEDSKRVYNVEANLYAVDTAALIWSVQTAVVNPKTIYDVVDTYSEQIVTRMIDDHILAP